MSYANWGQGLAVLFLLWALYVWRPRAGAAAAMMLVFGVLLWQFRNKKGVFGGVE